MVAGTSADGPDSSRDPDAADRAALLRAVDQVHLVRLGAEQGDHPRRRGQAARPGPDAEAQHQDRGGHRRPGIGQGDDGQGDEADRGNDAQPGRRGQLIADPDQPLPLAVLLLGGHDLQDEPRAAVDGQVPLEPAGVEYPAPSMLDPGRPWPVPGAPCDRWPASDQ